MRRSLTICTALLALLLAACTTPAKDDDPAAGCGADPAAAGCEEANSSDEGEDEDEDTSNNQDDNGAANNGWSPNNSAPPGNNDRPPGDDVPRNNDPGEEPDDRPPTPVSDGPWRFVLVEDLSNDDLDGPTPGADIDAIGIEFQSGPDAFTQIWAQSVEDFELNGELNEHIDSSELLGPPDAAACDDPEAPLAGFTSLGGSETGSYVVVSFGGATFSRGDALIVWELGPTNCYVLPQGWRDDKTRLSVSTSTDLSSFMQVGTIGDGSNAIFIP